jgi:ribosomal protein S18 acetylase RimI-like enzyme
MTTQHIRIRPAAASDRDFILGLAPRLAAASRLAWREAERLDRFSELGMQDTVLAVEEAAHEPTEAIFIAETDESQPLGVIHLKGDVSVLTDEPQGYISVLAVTVEAEGHGVGRALVAAGAAWARQRGYRHLALEVFATNRHARTFYEHLGFAEETLRMVKPLY